MPVGLPCRLWVGLRSGHDRIFELGIVADIVAGRPPWTAPVIVIVGLLVLLVVPIAAWLITHRKPSPGAPRKARPPGPKHRWWQP